MSNKKRSMIVLTTVILGIILLVLLFLVINKNNNGLKNNDQGITTTTNNQTNITSENEEKNENTTEKSTITTNMVNNNSNKITSTSRISSKKTTSKSSKTTKIDNNEEKEEVVKELSATAKGTSTDYNIVKAELSISNAHTPFYLEDYNGELMYKFTKIVELDVYSESAEFNFETKTNLNARIHEQAINKAKELYGDSGCVVGVENGYAMNKNGGYIGIIGKMVIGQLNEYNWCENNVKSIYLNNRTPLTQNDEKFIFE